MLVLLGLLQTTPPPLTNARVRAEFGPLGLVALADVAQHAVYRLTRDAFSLTIGGAGFGNPRPPQPPPQAPPPPRAPPRAGGAPSLGAAGERAAAWGIA